MLAGGTGSRLWPITKGISKQLLPIYNKPLIFFPIATLMMAGIKEILIITTPHDLLIFKKCLGDGSEFNVTFEFETQDQPLGLAQAFIIGEDFIGQESVALILGDNIFHGNGAGRSLSRNLNVVGARIFACTVSNPSDYGVVDLDEVGKPLKITEKPKSPTSHLAVPGLYFFDHDVVAIAKAVTKSERGELEITSILQHYLENGKLDVELFPRSTSWFDAGTYDSLLEASEYVRIVEKRQGQMIANLEEISWRNGWISDEKFIGSTFSSQGEQYSLYKESLIREKKNGL